MASLGAYLDSVSLPIVQKVLVGLGFGTVTFIGMQAVFNGLQSMLVQDWNSIPFNLMGLLALAGFPQAFGLILSAWSMRVTMMVFKRFQVVSAP